MRIFLVGDYKSGTGPANVTRQYLKYLPKGTKYLVTWNKLLRSMEIVWKTLFCQTVICSGYSRQNILALKWAAFTGKHTCYLMHGCVEYENGINLVPDERMNETERKTLLLAEHILAVSEPFERWLKNYYPEFQNKISHVTNGVSWEDMKNDSEAEEDRNALQVISVGGGMPRKKILYIAKAIEILRKKGIMTTLLVAGDVGMDSEKIDAYSFVRNAGMVSGDELKSLMQRSKLFIQNSCFETFGLAPLEALVCGCDILLSSHVGAISLFQRLEKCDIIEDCEDPEHIADKIEYLLIEKNHDRLWLEIDKESTSWEARTQELLKLLHIWNPTGEKKRLIG